MVVVQVAGRGRVEQDAEMVEAMAVMAADGGVEGHRHLAGVSFIADFSEQRFPLPQSFDDRLDQFTICRI